MVRQIGRHRLRHGNAMDDMSDLLSGRCIDLVYSDPPWGNGNLKMWGTLLHKDTGQSISNPGYRAFLEHLFTLCQRHARGPVVIEYGLRWDQEVIEIARMHGFNHVTTCNPLYKGGGKFMPMHLHLFARDYTYNDINLQLIIDVNAYRQRVDGTHGVDTVRAAMAPLVNPGDVIFDPCCGKGLGARVAHELGCVFYGNEINEKRLSEAEAALRR